MDTFNPKLRKLLKEMSHPLALHSETLTNNNIIILYTISINSRLAKYIFHLQSRSNLNCLYPSYPRKSTVFNCRCLRDWGQWGGPSHPTNWQREIAGHHPTPRLYLKVVSTRVRGQWSETKDRQLHYFPAYRRRWTNSSWSSRGGQAVPSKLVIGPNS